MGKLWLIVLGTAVAAPGCANLAPPNWSHPGPADFQQGQAQRFDPYPENESGPTIVGARPLEYDRPPAEVLRVQSRRDHLRPLRGTFDWRWR